MINCSGPLNDITKMVNRLMENLISRKLICPDEMKLGINARADGLIIYPDGKESNHLYTIGPNLRGILWESTVVPEIREQAKNIAEALIN